MSTRRVARAICATVATTGAFTLLAAGCSSPGEEQSRSEPVVTVTPQGAPTVKPRDVSGTGKVLVNGQGMTLYVNDLDTADDFKCVGECANEWPPVKVPSGTTVPKTFAGVTGAFTVVTRPGGARQLAIEGHPLYTFVRDKRPGMVRGNGFVDEGSGTTLTWHAITPTGGAPTASPTASPAPTDTMSPSPR
jgi:predicted lipoprotein with Yx(FWY)xxD motif